MRPSLPYLNKSVDTVPFEVNNKWFKRLNATDILLRADADKFDPQRAYAMIKEAFIDKLPEKRD